MIKHIFNFENSFTNIFKCQNLCLWDKINEMLKLSIILKGKKEVFLGLIHLPAFKTDRSLVRLSIGFIQLSIISGLCLFHQSSNLPSHSIILPLNIALHFKYHNISVVQVIVHITESCIRMNAINLCFIVICTFSICWYKYFDCI